jgi:hypothetical protein
MRGPQRGLWLGCWTLEFEALISLSAFRFSNSGFVHQSTTEPSLRSKVSRLRQS